MSCKLTALTIRKYGEEVTRLELTAERAEELAAEVNALNEAALAAAACLDFNDEPGQFPLALMRNRQSRGKTQ